jgi:hypothetical protein
MKTYSIEYLLKGAAGTMWVPNKENPVQAKDLRSVLKTLGEDLPQDGLVEFVGVRVETVSE